MLHRIKEVTVEENYKLSIVYENGSSVAVDFTPIIHKGGIFTQLSDRNFFAQVAIGQNGRHLQWPDEIEFCADALWLKSHPEENEFLELAHQE